jgi:hypothetical protein
MSKVWLGFVILSLPILSGCARSSAAQALPGVTVAGVVKLNGQPAVAARLKFVPIESTKGFGGHAFSDASGQFLVESSVGTNQLPVGKYKVVVETFRPPEDPELAAKFPAPAGQPTVIPPVYGDEQQTPLVALIQDDGSSVDLALTSR